MAGSVAVIAHPEIDVSDENVVKVGEAPQEKVYVFGRSVEVNGSAKEVLAVGGDVTIKGRVEGDVATLGGNVIQKETGYIGGDVIAIGGAYQSDSRQPQREPGKQTVVFGVLEQELRDFGQNPASVLSPSFSLGFIAQRVVLALLWFVISLVVVTIAPGAISRASTRLTLTPLKICAIGCAAFLGAGTLIVTGATYMPNFIGATLIGACLLLLIFGFVLGRVAIQVSVGKLLQRKIFPENNRSETLAILAGVLALTLVLSLPYVWPIALFLILASGIGLIFTARRGSVGSRSREAA